MWLVHNGHSSSPFHQRMQPLLEQESCVTCSTQECFSATQPGIPPSCVDMNSIYSCPGESTDQSEDIRLPTGVSCDSFWDLQTAAVWDLWGTGRVWFARNTFWRTTTVWGWDTDLEGLKETNRIRYKKDQESICTGLRPEEHSLFQKLFLYFDTRGLAQLRGYLSACMYLAASVSAWGYQPMLDIQLPTVLTSWVSHNLNSTFKIHVEQLDHLILNKSTNTI